MTELTFTEVVRLGSRRGAVTLDCRAGSHQRLDLAGDCVVRVLPMPAGTRVTVMVVQDSVGGHSLRFPGQPKLRCWEPFLTRRAGSVDILSVGPASGGGFDCEAWFDFR